MGMRLNHNGEFEIFVRHYVACMLWSSNDESNEQGGDPLDDNYDIDDIDPETMKEIRQECRDFLDTIAEKLELDELPGWNAEQAGHDFWLTRNGHGAGFWDRYWGDSPWVSLGDWLAKQVGFGTDFPEQNPYVGDDGKIYI